MLAQSKRDTQTKKKTKKTRKGIRRRGPTKKYGRHGPDSRGQTFRAPKIRCGTTEVSNMVNKNFGAPGMSKNMIFLSFFANYSIVGPFSWLLRLS
jgi:hypothetical protein